MALRTINPSFRDIPEFTLAIFPQGLFTLISSYDRTGPNESCAKGFPDKLIAF